MTVSRSLLVEEVHELTEMFRAEDAFRDIRDLAKRHDIDPATALLAGHLEDEDRSETGAIVAPDGRILWYERADYLKPEFKTADFVDDPTSLSNTFPAIHVAVELAAEASV